MRKIEKIFELIEDQNIKPAAFERENDLGNGYLKKIKDSSADITDKMLRRIEKNSKIFYDKLMGDNNKPTTGQNQAQEANPEYHNGSVTMNAIMSLAESNKGLVESNKALVESNRIIADANKSIADANVVLAKNNEELIQLMKKPTESVSEESPLTFQSNLGKLLAAIAQVGSGKRWHSQEEAIAALHKEFYGDLGAKKEAGIRSGSHK